jgi:hypothetical protein
MKTKTFTGKAMDKQNKWSESSIHDEVREAGLDNGGSKPFGMTNEQIEEKIWEALQAAMDEPTVAQTKLVD